MNLNCSENIICYNNNMSCVKYAIVVQFTISRHFILGFRRKTSYIHIDETE